MKAFKGLHWFWAVGLGLSLLLQGCGGNSSSSSGQGQVRLVNATHSHATIDLLLSGTKTISAVALGSSSAYSPLAGGTALLQVNDGTTQTALTTLSPLIADGQSYTFLAYESAGAMTAAWLTDNDAAPAAGSANLRVFNAAVDAGALDVYVTAPGVNLSTVASPTFVVGGQSVSQSSSFLAFTPGTYEVRVTGAGNRGDVRLDIPSLTIASQQVGSILLTPTVGGALVDGALLIEKAGYSAFANTNARVRIVSGVSGGQITASDGGTTIASGVASPSVGAYNIVPAGSSTWAVSVNGNAAAVPPLNIAAGSDNTLLITGTAAAASVSLVGDDNHLPKQSGTVNLRLVNGLGGSSVGLSMLADFVSVASNVLPGSAGAYTGVTGDANMRIEVDTPSSAAPLALLTALNLPAGGTYSVFVLGDASTPIVTVRKDR